MMKIGPAVAAAAVFAIASPVCAQDAVQWRVEDGGNGHWYRLVLVPSGVTWQAASVLCTQSGGHLVSITSVGERDLIAYLTPQTPGNGASPVRGWGPWIGAFQEAGAAEPAGGWRWVTDESWDATFWSGGQPDNRCTETGQAENFLSIHNAQGLTWNDLPLNGCDNDPVIAYWIEFDADCNSDGIVDYGQCRNGTLPDYDGNNIPDCCDQGQPCVVGNYPVQWRAAEGGNQNWYQLVISGSVTWEAARSASENLGGYLATPTQSPEREHLVRIASQPAAWIEHCCGLVGGPWLGGYQPAGASSSAPWRWVTGEPWSWTDWAPGEPNNGLQPEILVLSMWGGLPLGTNYFGWADAYTNGVGPNGETYILPLSYIIEWSADCNGDGIVDKGQILQGQLVDSDQNGVPDVCEIDPCPGDVTNGGTVDAADLSILLAAWGTNGQGEFDTDLNGDGLVDGGDLALILGGWGACP